MANKVYEETDIQAIAEAIRTKNGTSTTYTVAQMADAIEDITTEPVLQNKTVTPSTIQQIISSDTGYDGLNCVTVVGDTDLVSSNIKAGANIFGVEGNTSVVDTSDANVTNTDILEGKTAYVNGVKITGAIPQSNSILIGVNSSGGSEIGSAEEGQGDTIVVFPSSREQTLIYAGTYCSGDIVLAAVPTLKSSNIKQGVHIYDVTGTFTADATATATDILSGKTAYIHGEKITGTIQSQAATTITPSTSVQIVATAGTYIAGDIQVEAIPNNYGLITYNGVGLTVS